MSNYKVKNYQDGRVKVSFTAYRLNHDLDLTKKEWDAFLKKHPNPGTLTLNALAHKKRQDYMQETVNNIKKKEKKSVYNKEPVSIENVENDEFVPKEWLRKKISNEDVENDIFIPEKVWSIMKQEIRLGDEIWEFSTPPWMWECSKGRAGFALVRKGEIVQSIVTEMN